MTSEIERDSPEDVRQPVRRLDSLIGYRLRRASAAFNAHFFEAMEGNGMRPALFGMLETVAEEPGITQSDLGRTLRIRRGNMVPLVAELLERQLIERRASRSDRRVVTLFLTPEGEEFLADCRKRVLQHEEQSLSALSEEQRSALASMLLCIEQTLESGEQTEASARPTRVRQKRT
ncbi:MAG TPA: MarR family transcriptional regulator [Allosphingosinicella sp.]